ncbi:hypothetical protein [Terricaulis sp.]|uniref:hypothetical protein n=1 Tax=Terricaulis sp. TaxID=2768686 RepID=UPI002AC4CADA|nr:hypothetical protein [Terricaulis sp.]MDZ4691203.1 hypothetical protein [Terricaulis sp.]
MTREEMLQDIAYARTLAEEGRNAPLLGGAYLLFWGVLNSLAFLAHWNVVEDHFSVGNAGYAIVWMSYGTIAGVGMTLLRMRTREKPGLTTLGARAERAVWSGAGLALLAIIAGSIARMIISGDQTAPNAIFGAAFAIYGAALFAVSMMTDQAWLRAFAWLSISVAGTLCLFANESWAYLVAAIGSLLVLAWPGGILLKREPSAIV